jgi:hypothetical protein
MRAASPLSSCSSSSRGLCPEAGAKTPIPSVDRVVRKAVPPRTDPVDDLRREVEDVVNSSSDVVEKVFAPAPDVSVTWAPDVSVPSTPAAPQVVSSARQDTTADVSPSQGSAKRSGGRTQKAHKRSHPASPGRCRDADPAGQGHAPARQEARHLSGRGPPATRSIRLRSRASPSPSAGKPLSPSPTCTSSTGWPPGSFLIGLGALSLVTSRPRVARLSLRA